MADDPRQGRRNLDPGLLAFEQSLARGSLVIFPNPKARGATPGFGPKQARVLRFQYNPESITRTRSGQWDAKKNQKKKKPKGTGKDTKDTASKKSRSVNTPQRRALRDAQRGIGLFAKSEEISMKLVFDATELTLGGNTTQSKEGVLPELALLETAAMAKPSRDESGKKNNKLHSLHPSEVLLVLGPRRFPVVITSMTINEKRFNPDLTPVRAEVDLKLRVMETTEIKGESPMKTHWTALMEQRRRSAGQGNWVSNQSTVDAAISAAIDPRSVSKREG